MTIHNPHYSDVPVWMRLSDAPPAPVYKNQTTDEPVAVKPVDDPAYWRWTSNLNLVKIWSRGPGKSIVGWKEWSPGPYKLKHKNMWAWVEWFPRRPTVEQLLEIMEKHQAPRRKYEKSRSWKTHEYQAIRWGLGLVTAETMGAVAKKAQVNETTISKSIKGKICYGLCARKDGGPWSKMRLFRRSDGEYFHSMKAMAHSVEGNTKSISNAMSRDIFYNGFKYESVEVPGEKVLKIMENGGRDPQEVS